MVHAQTLRTALLDAAPREASRPLGVLLVALAALIFLVSDWRLALASMLLAGAVVFAGAIFALRGGLYVPVATVIATLVLAFAARAVSAWRGRHRTPRRPNIRHSG